MRSPKQKWIPSARLQFFRNLSHLEFRIGLDTSGAETCCFQRQNAPIPKGKDSGEHGTAFPDSSHNSFPAAVGISALEVGSFSPCVFSFFSFFLFSRVSGFCPFNKSTNQEELPIPFFPMEIPRASPVTPEGSSARLGGGRLADCGARGVLGAPPGQRRLAAKAWSRSLRGGQFGGLWGRRGKGVSLRPFTGTLLV